MHVHILGICGTFMGGIAALARELGHTVTGSDSNPYPPMSTQLEAQGIDVARYSADNLDPAPDMVVIGNALSRGNPEVEAVLEQDLPYTSGPQWLAEHLLRGRHVLAVAGTHGKTTTSSMLAWILEAAGLEPGFLSAVCRRISASRPAAVAVNTSLSRQTNMTRPSSTSVPSLSTIIPGPWC